MSIETCWGMVQILAKKLSKIADCPSEMESVDFCNEHFCDSKTDVSQCWIKWAEEKSEKESRRLAERYLELYHKKEQP